MHTKASLLSLACTVETAYFPRLERTKTLTAHALNETLSLELTRVAGGSISRKEGWRTGSVTNCSPSPTLRYSHAMTKRISYSPTENLASFIARYQARYNLGRPQEVIRDALLLLEEEELVKAYNQFAESHTLSAHAPGPASEPRDTRRVRVYRVAQ